MVLLSPTTLLITHSALGRIWRVEVKTGRAEPWLEDRRLQTIEGQKYPGANGLRRAGSLLYVSNSATRKLYTVAILDSGQAAGALAEAPGSFDGIDDFAIASDGALYVATHRGPDPTVPIAFSYPAMKGQPSCFDSIGWPPRPPSSQPARQLRCCPTPPPPERRNPA